MRAAFVLTARVAVVLAATSGIAHANGRFPRAERVLEVNGDPQKLVLAATYGLLVTQDRGAEWRHVCELGYARSVNDIDQIVDVVADGALLANAARSLNLATPPYCNFELVLGGTGSETVADFSIDRGDPSHVVALMARRGDGGSIVNQLYESSNAGRTFAELGAPLPPEDVRFGITLDLAPSDPSRIYVSASGPNGAVLLRSDDRASSWTTTLLDLDVGESPYIAAVHPTDPDTLYVRTDAWLTNADGVLEANDALFHSDDGGASFQEVFRAGGKLFGFALSPDASRILIGYGDPVAPGSTVELGALGIYAASTEDHEFTKIFEGPVSCLAWTASGVYACTLQQGRGFALGFAASDDFTRDDANPLTPLLDLQRVQGPLDCPACSSGAACRALWSESCLVFDNCETGAAATGGNLECSAGGASGAGGATGGGGTSSGSTAGAAGRMGATAGSDAEDGSCACRAGRSGAYGHAFVATLLLVIGLGRRLPTRRGSAHAPTRAKRDE